MSSAETARTANRTNPLRAPQSARARRGTPPESVPGPAPRRNAPYNDAVIAGISLLLALSATAPAPGIYSDVTGAAGLSGVSSVSGSSAKDYILETIGTGVAAFDYDNDGWQDLFFVSGSRLEGFPAGQEPVQKLFRNRGDGSFEDVTARSGLAIHFWGQGVASGDYDNDGMTDLYVSAWGPDRLFRNRGDGTFADVSEAAGVRDDRWGASAAFADFNNDGFLDLFVANYVAFDTKTVPRRADPERPCYYRGAMVMCGPTGLQSEVDILYRNNGDGTFTDATLIGGVRSDVGMFGLGVAVADYDEDGDADIYVANDATPNQLYRNRGDGSFDEVGAMSGVAYGADGTEQGSMGTSFGDYDGDGRLDIVVTNFSHQSFQIYRYAGDGFFEDATYVTGVAEATFLSLGWATDFLDYDNDGDLDLFFANGHVYPGVDAMQIGTTYLQRNQLLRNDPAPSGTGRVFVDLKQGAGPGFEAARSYRGGGPFDVDRDGDLDLILTVMDGAPVMLRNDSAAGGAWLDVRPVGRRANRSGVGVRVAAIAGDSRQVRHSGGGGSFLWSCDPWVHFGLSGQSAADLEVVWPGGAKQTFRGVKTRAAYVLLEGENLRELPRATGAVGRPAAAPRPEASR